MQHLFSTYCMPETNLSALQVLMHLMLILPYGVSTYYYPCYFTDEETEAQSGSVTGPSIIAGIQTQSAWLQSPCS